MAAPSGTVWGSIKGDYGRIGIYVKLTTSSTTVEREVQIWYWSKYSTSDVSNDLYYDSGQSITSATTNRGSVSISTTSDSGGWSTTNQQKLKTYTSTYTRGTSAKTYKVYAKLSGVERVGSTMYVNTSFKIPALAKYTIKYSSNGGSGAPSSQTKYYGKTLTLSSTKPTRTGYTFKNWNTKSDGSGTSYSSGGKYTSNASVTLYAQWQIKTYTIKYNANGGSGAPSSQTKTYNKTLILSSTIPTRTGEDSNTTYTFKGWHTSSSATSILYKAGGNYTENVSDTLYAVWSSATSYDIVYNANGGSGAPSPQTKGENKTITISSTIPIRDGYVFSEWNTSADGGGTSYESGASYSTNDDLVLYAIWSPWTHTVSFNANGGTNAPSSFEKTNDIEAFIPDTIPSKDGYIFRCWNTESDGSGNKYMPDDSYEYIQNGGTVTLYAIWINPNILIYNNANCEAICFIEGEEEISFSFDGVVSAVEFIENSASPVFSQDFIKFKQIIEKK